MNRENPIIAFTIGMFNAIDGPLYCVYTQAYGMEMQVDDEWPLNILIMAPPHLVSALTKGADVASMGMIPGASYTPGDGDYKQIVDHDGRWVVARRSDDLEKIVKSGLGVLLVIDDEDDLVSVNGVVGLTSENLIVAFKIDSVSTLDSAGQRVLAIQTALPKQCRSSPILISGSFDHENLPDYASVAGVSGLLLLDASFDCILELIETMLG